MEIKRKFKIINDFEHEINKIIYVLRSVCLMEIKPSYLNLLMRQSLFISQRSTALHFSVTLFTVEIYATEC